jgi:hypothetical protein
VAEAIHSLRQANARQAARAIGQDPVHPTTTLGVQRQGYDASILALPADPEPSPILQDLDPTSPTFGLFYFMVSYDKPGDPTKPIR